MPCSNSPPNSIRQSRTNGAQPMRAIDPATQTEYVLLRADIYDQIKNLVSDDRGWVDGAYLASMEVFARDGWDDRAWTSTTPWILGNPHER